MRLKRLKPTARVIPFAPLQTQRNPKPFIQDESADTSLQELPNLAPVVSLRDRVGRFASIEVDELSAITPPGDREVVMAHVRRHLAAEFGQLRVTEHFGSFTVRHRNAEEIVGALLRVQYRVFQCSEHDLAHVGDDLEFCSLHLTWGLGASAPAAAVERVKRRQRKRFHEDS